MAIGSEENRREPACGAEWVSGNSTDDLLGSVQALVEVSLLTIRSECVQTVCVEHKVSNTLYRKK
jgi:hypothetical protein